MAPRSDAEVPTSAGRVAGPVTVHLVRHAVARARAEWADADRLRPLTEKGRAQADALAERLARTGSRVARVLSSPATRCRETVEPAAARLGLAVEEEGALAEGSDPPDVLAHLVTFAAALEPGAALAACTHGDVLEGILEMLEPRGVAVDGPLAAPKAVTWELDVEGGELVAARYVPPPTLAELGPRR